MYSEEGLGLADDRYLLPHVRYRALTSSSSTSISLGVAIWDVRVSLLGHIMRERRGSSRSLPRNTWDARANRFHAPLLTRSLGATSRTPRFNDPQLRSRASETIVSQVSCFLSPTPTTRQLSTPTVYRTMNHSTAHWYRL